MYLVTSRVGKSWRNGTSPGFLCDWEEDGEEDGVCKILANLFCLLLQKFFTSLSVLPGKYVAILAHLFPNCACNSITSLSSSDENLHPLGKIRTKKKKKKTKKERKANTPSSPSQYDKNTSSFLQQMPHIIKFIRIVIQKCSSRQCFQDHESIFRNWMHCFIFFSDRRSDHMTCWFAVCVT